MKNCCVEQSGALSPASFGKPGPGRLHRLSLFSDSLLLWFFFPFLACITLIFNKIGNLSCVSLTFVSGEVAIVFVFICC